MRSHGPFELHYRLHWHRPGGGFRATLEPGAIQVGPVFLTRVRQPIGAPALDLARVGQGYVVVDDDTGEETTGWHRDWTGVAFARLGWCLSVPDGSRAGRAIDWVDRKVRTRRNRRRFGRGVDGPGVSLMAEGDELHERHERVFPEGVPDLPESELQAWAGLADPITDSGINARNDMRFLS
jgi:hypothetical protein